MSLNKVILIGNVGQDPDIKRLDGGRVVARFSLATSESYKDRDGQKHTLTEWHTLEAWSGQAEILEKYVKKGDRLYIEGKIKTDSWEDQSGQRKYMTKIQVKSLIMLGSPGSGSNTSTGSSGHSGDEFLNQETPKPETVQATLMMEGDDDDLPF